uniref:Uncharacterized protein n=1 Tax=Arundo donax TaxID=35708 RepID=A0A0A9FNJ8_ARUDO
MTRNGSMDCCKTFLKMLTTVAF